jgi:N6-L-threonylcarbamoyladenine synthase
MRILGIETSCDETAVCLLEARGDPPAGGRSDFHYTVLGNALLSQAALHAQYGGVFPNLAKREHAKNLVPMLEKCLHEAGQLNVRPTRSNIADLSNVLEREPELLEQLVPFLQTYEQPPIDAIAVTAGPGLEPALWVGINFAKALGMVWSASRRIPIVAVNHMEGHILMSMMEVVSPSSGILRGFEYPVLALLISGGHTELVISREFGHYELVGQTRDDAVGEAFDKVARLLGLGYPGGPEISHLAREAREVALPRAYELPRPMLHEDNLDFSFSGLKTAVRRLVEANPPTEEMKKQLAREFEDAVADVLVEKTLRAIDAHGVNTVVVGGGVSANQHIRDRLAEALAQEGGIAKLLVPPPDLATDNALMIALAGYFHAHNRDFVNPDMLQASGNLTLGPKL